VLRRPGERSVGQGKLVFVVFGGQGRQRRETLDGCREDGFE
jgi:hypothetical protein